MKKYNGGKYNNSDRINITLSINYYQLFKSKSKNSGSVFKIMAYLQNIAWLYSQFLGFCTYMQYIYNTPSKSIDNKITELLLTEFSVTIYLDQIFDIITILRSHANREAITRRSSLLVHMTHETYLCIRFIIHLK